MSGRLWMGCSGWSYAHWREPVYHRAPESDWLARYAELFGERAKTMIHGALLWLAGCYPSDESRTRSVRTARMMPPAWMP